MSKEAEASGNLRKLIGNERAKKMGNYTESTGGGTPIPKGEKLKDHPEAKRVKQPRDEEGKFTYNAVNFKDLKYGPSRGKTVPPFLRGLHLDTNLINANGKVITDGKRWNISGLEMSKQELLNNFKEYRGNEEGFGDFEKAKFSGVRGRPSKDEKEIMNSKEAHGYYGDTQTLGQYNSTQDLQDNMKKLRREQENRKYRKTLLGVQGKLGEKGINKSIPEIKEMIKSGEVEKILGPNYMGDVHKGLIKNKKSNKDENAGQAQDTNPESGVDKQNNQETPQNGSEVGEENNNTNQEQNVLNDNANNDIPSGNTNEVPENQENNVSEKSLSNDEMPSTGGGENPSGNMNLNEVNRNENESSQNNQSKVDNVTPSNEVKENASVPTGGGETPSGNAQSGEEQQISENSAEENTISSNRPNYKRKLDDSDFDLAAKDSRAFEAKYEATIENLLDYCENTLGDVLNMTAPKISKFIAKNRKIKNFGMLKNAFDRLYEEKTGKKPIKDAFSEQYKNETKKILDERREAEKQEREQEKAFKEKERQEIEQEKALQKQNEEYIKKQKELNKQKREEDKKAAIQQNDQEKGLGANNVNKRKVDYDRELDENDLNNLTNNKDQFKNDNYSTLLNLTNYAKNELRIKNASVDKMVNFMEHYGYKKFGELKQKLDSFSKKGK